jgi:hypothetical protein
MTEPRPLPPLKVPAFVRYLDLVVLLMALPIFVLADLPMAAYLVGGGAWILQRVVQLLMQRRAGHPTIRASSPGGRRAA